jgi:glycosyltransferase involved in cell wall biosynthesis
VLGTLAGQGFELAIVNTSISARSSSTQRRPDQGRSLVHELPEIIRSHGLEKNAAIARASDVVVFESSSCTSAGNRRRNQGRARQAPRLYRTEVAPDETARARVRAELNLPPDAKIVLNVGFADARKGFDLFAGTAKALGGERSDVYFLWIGQLEYGTPNASSHSAACGEVITLGFRDNVAEYYSAADASSCRPARIRIPPSCWRRWRRDFLWSDSRARPVVNS